MLVVILLKKYSKNNNLLYYNMFFFYIIFYCFVLQIISIFVPSSENFINLNDINIKDNLIIWLRYSLFITMCIGFIIIMFSNQNNVKTLLSLLLIFLTIIKLLVFGGIFNDGYFNIIIYPIFYIIIFYSIFVFLNKIPDYNLFKPF